MKPLILAGLVLAVSGCADHHTTPAAAGATPTRTAAWTLTEGVETPESAYIDAGSGSIFVSMIAGAPDGRDGNGRIARLATDGKLISANWVSGLNAPKGMRSFNGTLWVADLDEVVGIDIASAKISSRLKIPNAVFLNDVACGPDGTVYVSDMLASRIFAVKDGKATVFAEGEQFEYPNGLLVEGNRLIVGGWGSKPQADFTTKVPGNLYALDLKTAARTTITPKPIGNLDGVESDGHGGWYVSDYLAGTVIQVSDKGEPTVVAKFAPGAADIAFTHANHTLIVPHMNENKVAAYDLAR